MIARTMSILSTPYALIGLVGLMLAAVALSVGWQGVVLSHNVQFAWQSVTGVGLLSTMTYQWYLLRKRWIGDMTRRDVVIHRWAGVAAVILFGLHAARLGHTWMMAITVLFILIGITGILNKEVMRYKTRRAYLTWFAIHIGLSVAIAPLIAVHVWVALSY